MPNIDLHAHVVVPEVTTAGGPESWRATIEERAEGQVVHCGPLSAGPLPRECSDWPRIVEEMDRARVDVAAVSPVTLLLHYGRLPQEGLAAARLQNDGLARAARDYPGRFAPLGTLPMQDTDPALRELERLDEELGLSGVELGTNVAGAYLGERRFWPVYAEIERRGLCIFIHPVAPLGREKMARFELVNAVGFPLETTLTVAHMILSGVFDAHPRLKVVLPHGGGSLPYLRGRLEKVHRQRPPAREGTATPPSQALGRLYFDTIVHSSEVLRGLIDWAGPERIVLGSDYPFDMGYEDPAAFVEALGLPPTDTERICGGNARSLLKLA